MLVALLLIFFYLLYVVKPIFNGASMESRRCLPCPSRAKPPARVEEQNRDRLPLQRPGKVKFFAVQPDGKIKTGQVIGEAQVNGEITAVAPPAPGQKLIAYGFCQRQGPGGATLFPRSLSQRRSRH